MFAFECFCPILFQLTSVDLAFKFSIPKTCLRGQSHMSDRTIWIIWAIDQTVCWRGQMRKPTSMFAVCTATKCFCLGFCNICATQHFCNSSMSLSISWQLSLHLFHPNTIVPDEISLRCCLKHNCQKQYIYISNNRKTFKNEHAAKQDETGETA